MYGLKENLLNELRRIAKEQDVSTLLLFGSRARGDYRERSDIDLAVIGGNAARFALEVEETPTLLEFDVVDMNHRVQKELKESIEREGIVLYEKG